MTFVCLVAAEMAHESGGGADGSPQHTPSPPHAPRLPIADTSFHQQIMQVRITAAPSLANYIP